jgi:Holliday junction resolvase RusA-like endonuclease
MIDVLLPMPPSVNKAYVSLRNRRILSTEGKLYKQAVRDKIGEQYALTPLPNLENTPLELSIELTFTDVENAGWSKGKAKNRYKRIDVSNRVKLLEDALFETLDVDDSLVFSLHVTKRAGADASVRVIIRAHEGEGG